MEHSAFSTVRPNPPAHTARLRVVLNRASVLRARVLNQLLTKTTQASRGWVGRVFDAEGPSYVELLTPSAAVDRIGYALANRTAAGLVRHSCE